MSDRMKALALVQEFQTTVSLQLSAQSLAEQARRSSVEQVVENLVSVAWALQDHSEAIERLIVSAQLVLQARLAAALLMRVRKLLIEDLLSLEVVEYRRQGAG